MINPAWYRAIIPFNEEVVWMIWNLRGMQQNNMYVNCKQNKKGFCILWRARHSSQIIFLSHWGHWGQHHCSRSRTFPYYTLWKFDPMYGPVWQFRYYYEPNDFTVTVIFVSLRSSCTICFKPNISERYTNIFHSHLLGLPPVFIYHDVQKGGIPLHPSGPNIFWKSIRRLMLYLLLKNGLLKKWNRLQFNNNSELSETDNWGRPGTRRFMSVCQCLCC